MNGYTQLNLLGRNRGLKFGALAAEQIMVKLAKLQQDTGGIYTSSMITEIIYWGLVNNCYAKREDPDFTFEEVMDWVDGNWINPEMAETLTAVVKCFEESKSSKALTEKVTEAIEKKKAEMSGSVSDQ